MIVKGSTIRDRSPQSQLYEDCPSSNIQNKISSSGQGLKEQMLKLSIFQNKSGLDKINNEKVNEATSYDKVLMNKNLNSSTINRKKAEFEKKIRKFIESDSPPQQIHKSPISKVNLLKSVPKKVR